MRMFGRCVVGVLILAVLVAVAPSISLFVLKISGSHLWNNQHESFEGQNERVVRLEGVQFPVSIVWDTVGVPSIFGKTMIDIFYAQGYAHALDRLWQMELRRSVALGTLSQKFGKPALQIDIFARTLNFRSVAEDYIRSLELNPSPMYSKLLEQFQAYCDGVNAAVASSPLLPLEFYIAGFSFEPWTPVDSVAFALLMQFGLEKGWQRELPRENLVSSLGVADADHWDFIEDFIHSFTVNHGEENPGEKPDNEENEEGNDESHGEGQLSESESNEPTGHSEPELENEAKEREVVEGILNEAGVIGGIDGGSNAWAISGKFTESGFPMLANDPHLVVTAPNVWYQVRLVCPECEKPLNAAGASLAAAPGLPLGRNERIGWGVTVACTDTSDLYYEKINFKNLSYEFNGRSHPLQHQKISIPIKGGDPYVFTRYETHHGPVLTDVLLTRKPISLSLSSFKTFSTLEGVYYLAIAQNWSEFVEAVHRISGNLNFLYADVDGNIGYQLAGRVPVRKNPRENGKQPNRGWIGEGEWLNFVPPEDLPSTLNPPEGFIVSANSFIDNNPKVFLGENFAPNSRATRIRELIEESMQRIRRGGSKIDLGDHMQWQVDILDVYARQAIPIILSLLEENPDTKTVLSEWKNWNFEMSPNSKAALYWSLFKVHFGENLLRSKLVSVKEWSEEERENVISMAMGKGFGRLVPTLPHGSVAGRNILQLLRKEGGSFLPHRDFLEILKESIIGVSRDQRIKQYGTWGKAHQITWPHSFSTVPLLKDLFEHGSFEFGGNSDTPLQAASAFPSLNANSFVPSYRMVLDFSVQTLKGFYFLNAPGQSGHPWHPNYSNMISDFLSGSLWQVQTPSEK